MTQTPLNLSPEELHEVLPDLNCIVTLETTLATFPGSIHWHIKHRDYRSGVLEATWTTNGDAWLSNHGNRYQPWIDRIIDVLNS